MTQEPVVLVVEFQAAPGRTPDLRAALLELTVATRPEDGCVLYDLHEDVDDPGILVFYEIWDTAAAHAAHDATPHVQAFVSRFDELIVGRPRVRRLRRLEPRGA